ncbi:MAG: tetratricopeptide repeat protein, partial [Myxococcales bacterium]|nr:tetratricopeptide repeat protein [Myxococcales bacterium]
MELQHSSPRSRGRTARGSALLCVVIAVATLEPSVAAAAPSADGVARLHDVERARVELALGQRRYDEGRYEQALPAFEAAYAAYPVAELQFNVALCHERLGHTVAAIDAFEAYLADAIDSTDRADVEARLAVLRAALPAPSAPAVVPSTPAATRAPADLIDPFRLGRRAPPTPRPTG